MPEAVKTRHFYCHSSHQCRDGSHSQSGVDGDLSDGASDILGIDCCQIPQTGWNREYIRLEEGTTMLATAEVADGIAITYGKTRALTDTVSQITFDTPVAILGFGIRGETLYRASNSHNAGVIRPNTVVLYHPEYRMYSETPAQDDYRAVGIKFAPHRISVVLDEVFDLYGKNSGMDRDALQLSMESDLRRELRSLLTNPLVGALDRLMAESEVLSLVSRYLVELPQHATMSTALLSPDERKAVGRILDMLVSDLSDTPKLETLMKEANMTHTRLNRCFKKAYGNTVFGWLREYRLNEAMRLLRQDHQSITDIAYACGFSSSSHFGAIFKERFGCSPKQYRQQAVQH